ncbi:MAG: hypothetical protein AAF423_08960 [Pseudomonadota bacterium]
MRILTIGLFAAFVIATVDTADSPQREGSKTENTGLETLAIDPISTGVTISSEHMEKWEAERKRYLECPECVASQPFPED